MSDQISQWWSQLRSRAEEYGIEEKIKQAGSALDNQVRLKAGEYGLQEKLNYAGQVIDTYDRKIEDLENNAASYFKQKGVQVYDRVLDSLDPVESSSEVLFEQNNAPSSRVDAQIKALHHSPELFMNCEPRKDQLETDQFARAQAILKDDPDLRKLHESLVPEKVTDKVFWLRYFELREDIEEQDRQRKEILKHKPAEDEEIDWGSSEEEGDSADVVGNKDEGSKPSKTPKSAAKDEPSDSDWE